ncbi:MAG: 16S rRNA (cytidine(1402)-2'-O)-methyltransferase [Oscillospiraceae bacterium]|nr:16S rRNA (cytidine(1402)-2'-O)-methyltransferase [Oscillospiraceae bacterium]
MSTLYIVGTPIGNLDDISPRALETLETVDFIAAEDTRVTLKLLNRFEIKNKLISCHKHSGSSVFTGIIQRLQAGETCALVSDAGMPCISDPGQELVAMCYEHGIKVCVIPGPTAALSALSISGLDTSRFSFEGFLSVTKKQRRAHLEEVKGYKHTLIFYEAPHKLIYTLKDMLEVFGDRRISLCRELTKIHEEVIRTTLSQAVTLYESLTPKGEFVLIIEGAPQNDNEATLSFEDALDLVKQLCDEGEKLSNACKIIASKTEFSKSELYNALC